MLGRLLHMELAGDLTFQTEPHDRALLYYRLLQQGVDAVRRRPWVLVPMRRDHSRWRRPRFWVASTQVRKVVDAPREALLTAVDPAEEAAYVRVRPRPRAQSVPRPDH